MKQVLLFLSAAAMLLIGWQVISGLAQEGFEIDTSPLPKVELSRPERPAGADAGEEAAFVEEALSEPPPGPIPPQDRPVASRTPDGSAASAPLTPEDFEIDRSAPYPPAEAVAAAAAEQGATNGGPAGWAEQAEPKDKFLDRMFGSGKGRERVPAPTAGVPSAVPKAPVAGAPTAAEAAPFIPPVSAPQGEESKPDSPEALMAFREEARRQAIEIECLKNIDLAYQAMGRADFDAAIKLFDIAVTNLPRRPYTVDTLGKARSASAQCEYRLALNAYEQGNAGAARQHLARALDIAPNHKDAQRLRARIERAGVVERRPAAAEAKTPREPRQPSVGRTPEISARQKRIKDALLRGRQYMAVREYDKAAREFTTVLLEDEGNEDANANLKKIADTGYQLETFQFERMKSELMTQVRDAWTPAVKKDFTPVKEKRDDTGVISMDKQKLLKKLQTIIIPQLDFREANIADVIKFLDTQSIVADTASPAGEKGVNIMLNLARPGQPGAAAAAPAPAPAATGELDFGAEGQPEAAGAAAGATGLPTVTMTLRNVVLLDAIKFITEVTGLKYRVEANVVMITPADVVFGEVVTKTFRVQPNLAEIIRGSLGAGAAPAAGGIGTDLIATPAAAAPAPGSDVKKFFVDAGVPFPEGTSIKYQQSLNLLIVANTAENLEKFEEILSHLNVIPMQVEIEARFVEIGQTDLEELGFEWLLTDNWEIAQDASAGAAVPISARQRIQVNKNPFTKGLRNLALGDGTATPSGDLAGILSISSILTNPELSFILHALEQRSGANLLSAPKVTTKSGANAEIKVVREIIYPTEFESSTQNAGGTQTANTAVVVTPTAFETRDTGVILNVTPVVGPDGYTIDLAMMPQVVELSDWINYGSTVMGPGGEPQQINMPQPVFHSRSIATSISIWDGQTVVMGGLITENQGTTEDKIPFLGDIPLIGFFFKSKTTKSVKRNLLIFVSANLVDPAGNKINKEAVNLASPPVAVAVSAGPAAP